MIKSLDYFHAFLSGEDLLIDGNRKEELIKMMLHTLDQMGYKKTVQKLAEESKVRVEDGPLAQLGNHVLTGKWPEALKCVDGLGLDAEKSKKICFLINEERYIELIVSQQYNEALLLLRNELVQCSGDGERLSKLAAILMCSNVKEIEEKLDMKLDIQEARIRICKEIEREFGAKNFMDGSRFHKLIHQAITFQFGKCRYHESKDHGDNVGLMEDHACGIEEYPSKAYLGFQGQSDDVRIVKFSNKGDLVATVTRGKELCIWDLKMQSSMTPKLKHKISKIHEKRISCLNWSPNDKKILTASFDKKVKVWDVETGALKMTLQSHQDAVHTAVWIPGSQNFISAGLDNYMVLWNSLGEEVTRITSCKITQLLVSSDGRRLYLISALHPKVIVVDTITQTEINWIQESGVVAEAVLSKDSRFLLTQLPHPISELHLWDLEKQHIIQTFSIHTKDAATLGFCFGGTEHQFIACGTEQGAIKIWHRNHAEPVRTLKSHSALVNSISWHPQSPHVLISSSEDRTTCIWISEHLHSMLKDGDACNGKDGQIADSKENERLYEEKLYEFEENV